MIIRATNKALKMSKMIPIKRESVLNDNLPGEWYVDLISLGKPGKFGLHFIHHPTLISVVVPGRSLSTIFQSFTVRTIDLLSRHKYDKLIPFFHLDSVPDIYATNSRSMLAYLRQVKWDSEYHCHNAKSIDEIDFNWIEDVLLDCLFGTTENPHKYKSPKLMLDRFMQI
jgi:hypothetical protein